MEIKDELIDELIKGYQNPEEILGENGLLKQLTKEVLERCLQGASLLLAVSHYVYAFWYVPAISSYPLLLISDSHDCLKPIFRVFS